MKRFFVLCSIVLASAACSSSAPPRTDNAPWQQARLSDVPSVYRTAWQEAENRSTCALVAFADTRSDNASPRRATFAGGWAVAYDTPSVRSAFGLAGTGVDASGPTYDEWPHKRTWSDGSSVGYGPEGGTGPNQLAYLRLAGQGCLYNVWSRLGQDHLEYLLSQIRFVN